MLVGLGAMRDPDHHDAQDILLDARGDPAVADPVAQETRARIPTQCHAGTAGILKGAMRERRKDRICRSAARLNLRTSCSAPLSNSILQAKVARHFVHRVGALPAFPGLFSRFRIVSSPLA